MEGVNGYDFVRLDERPGDETVLQVNGVPVLVQPKLLPNDAADVDLRLRDQILDGVNGYDYVQLADSKEKKAPGPPAADEDLSGLDQRGFLQRMFGSSSPMPPKMDQLL